MTRHGFILMALAIIAIAVWAYNVNYNTKTTLKRVADLRAEIAEERESLQVLRVEWAYLNAPERLKRLLVEHGRSLDLVPIEPSAMAYVAAVPYGDDALAVAPRRRTGSVPIPRARPAGWRTR